MKNINNEEILRGDLVIITIQTPIHHTAEIVIYLNNHERVYDVEEDGEPKSVTTNTVVYYPLTSEGLEVATHDSGTVSSTFHRQKEFQITHIKPQHVAPLESDLLTGTNKTYYDAIQLLL